MQKKTHKTYKEYNKNDPRREKNKKYNSATTKGPKTKNKEAGKTKQMPEGIDHFDRTHAARYHQNSWFVPTLDT